MKKIILSGFCLCFTYSLFSQLDSFDLNRYKLANFDFRSLNTKYDLSGFGSDRTYKGTGSATDRTRRLSFSGNAGIEFNSQKNRRKFIENHRASFSTNPKYSSNENGNFFDWENSGAHIYNKAFYNAKEQFVKLGDNINLGTQTIKGKDETTNSVNFYCSLPVSIGAGRLENVTDVWRAVRHLQNLKAVNRLSIEPSDSIILSFAELLTTRRRNRFFDFRYDRIDDLQAVDDFLKSKKIISDNDIVYFNSLSDQWGYGANTFRYSGKVFEVGFTPELNYEFSRNNDSTIVKNRNYDLGVFFEYVNNKAVNQLWQFNHSAKISSGLFENMNLISKREIGGFFINPSLTASLGYYPNTRTEYEVSLTTNFRYQTYEVEQERQSEDKNYAAVLGGNIYHFLSPRTRVSGSLNLNYSNSDRYYENSSTDWIRSDFYMRFSVRLEYFIF